MRRNVILFPFLLQCTPLYLTFFFLPPSPNALSFHYIALFHRILTINFYPTPLLFQHLLPFTSEEDGGWNLLSYGLYCSGHFLINTTDKAVGFQLMQMQQATPGLKLPYCPLSSTLFWPWLPSECLEVPWFVSSPPRAASSLRPIAYSIFASLLRPFNFLLGPRANMVTFRLHPRSSGTHSFHFGMTKIIYTTFVLVPIINE